MPTLTLTTFTDASVGPWQVAVCQQRRRADDQTLQKPGPIQVPWDSSWGTATVTVQVGDRGGLYGTATVQVSTTNSPPVVGSISFVGSTDGGLPVVGLPAAAWVGFSGPGLGNRPYPEGYTCTVDYGDGSGPQAGTAGPQPNGTGGVCVGPIHTYAHFGQLHGPSNRRRRERRVGRRLARLDAAQRPPPRLGPVRGSGPPRRGSAFSSRGARFVDDNGSNSDSCLVDFRQRCGLVWGDQRLDLHGFPRTRSQMRAPTPSRSRSSTASVPAAAPSPRSWWATWRRPSMTSMSPERKAAGGVVTAQAGFDDPSSNETFVCTVDFGDGTAPQPGLIGDAAVARLITATRTAACTR